jgi:small-conductance mechanosensitive channel
MVMEEFIQNWEPLLWALGALGGSIVLTLIIHYLLFRMARTIARKTRADRIEALARHCSGPGRLIIFVLLVNLFQPLVEVPSKILLFFNQAVNLLLIFSAAWLLIRFTHFAEEQILNQFRVDVADNLEARRIHTQIQILRKVIVVVIVVVALAISLMTFEKVRQLGTTILASAGIVGIIVGIAAQKSIATLLAGLQLAITQPIRMDDVVIVENEWGRIEDITLTYVVVKIWDLRRLIVPMTYFLEKPFQNWTRISADLLGTVFLYVDYTVPAEAVREELKRIAENSPLWDKQVCTLQVTNTSERTIELRALVSAADASQAWNLRCEVREKLIQFLQTNYPEGLPKMRAELLQRDSDLPAFHKGEN